MPRRPLANGRSVQNGREYEIRFRARWVAGSPLLNTRLFFNRLPQTTILPVPEQTGTPGTRKQLLGCKHRSDVQRSPS